MVAIATTAYKQCVPNDRTVSRFFANPANPCDSL